jgi:hypothetical protein
MKLYTEEQVVEFTMNMISQYEFGNKDIWNKELLKESFQYVTPIELPSDEEIRTMSLPTNVGDSYHSEYIKGFNYGAKWVIEQIKEQDGRE